MSKVEIVSVSENTFGLKISAISKLDEICSPIQVVQDIPWKIKIFKNIQNANQLLGISLCCAKSDPSPKWSHAASASFNLVSFTGSTLIESISEPYAFSSNELSVQFPSIDWDDLNDAKNFFVENDSIQLNITIKAADPYDVNQSVLMFGCTERCCENDCLITFHLTVLSLSNLMAVRSPQFLMRCLMWDFTIYKSNSSWLGIRLGSKTMTNKLSCKVKMTLRLMSSKEGVAQIQHVKTMVVRQLEFLLIGQIVKWDDLMKSINGFVENDSVTLQIEIQTEKIQMLADGKGVLNEFTEEIKPVKMECAVCLDVIHQQNISCPPCGHLFCSDCITGMAKKRKTCPSCNILLTVNGLRRVFLPM